MAAAAATPGGGSDGSGSDGSGSDGGGSDPRGGSDGGSDGTVLGWALLGIPNRYRPSMTVSGDFSGISGCRIRA